MTFNDPIAQLLTHIRNAKNAKLRFVDITVSKLKLEILKILKDKGFIQNYLLNDKLKKVRVFLKYTPQRKSVIQGLKRISSPGLRRYIASDAIPKIKGGIGISILSTSKGIVDGSTAVKLNIGGEILCYVW